MESAILVAPLDKDVTRLSLGHWNSQYAMQFEKNPHLLFRSDKDVLNCRIFVEMSAFMNGEGNQFTMIFRIWCMFIYVLYCIYLIHIRINLYINIIFLSYRQIGFAKNVRQYRYTLPICGVSNHFKSKSIMYSKNCILSTVKYFNISILSLMLASS